MPTSLMHASKNGNPISQPGRIDTAVLKSPYPFFGGKSVIAPRVWQRFGRVQNFVEPFFGSGAILLGRPVPFVGTETVNDLDGMIANFWRALKADPTAVARWADWPVNENDLHARHAWLVERKDSLQARLEGDPDYFDPKIAGWWAWGMACWIGAGFCSGDGPWQVVEVDGSRQLVHLGNAGRGVNRQLVHLGDAGQGVKRQRVHLNAGQGLNRKRVHLGDAGQGVKRAGLGECGLRPWLEALAARLERVRVCCGEWNRVCGPTPTVKQGLTAVFLDPPYADTAARDPDLYRIDSQSVAHDVREWAIEHGDDPLLRIALCGYEDEHAMPASWSCMSWNSQGGYSNQGNGQGKVNRYRERVWFSPHCISDMDCMPLFRGKEIDILSSDQYEDNEDEPCLSQ